MDIPDSASTIEIRIDRVSQLFDTLDPFPFPERDLDRDAEEFIAGWGRELKRDRPIQIVIHLPASEAETEAARELGDAIARYFNYRARAIGLDLRELFRVGRMSLAIGMAVLAFCLFAAQTASNVFGPSPLARFATESLLILGWVANWRPIEIFLYEWWPIVRRRNLYRRLAASTVTLKPH